MQPDPDRVGRFVQALHHTLDAIDWVALGDSYCEYGGEGFFTEEAIDAMRDAGLLIASDLAEKLAPLKPAASLYVGIGVAELVPILFEALMLERKVTAFTLPSPEAAQIQAALTVAQTELGLVLPSLWTTPLKPKSRPECSHLWLASVVTDPDAFPGLHDELYQRRGTHQATGRGNAFKERKRAIALFETALSWLLPPACITTSQEELPILEATLGDFAKNLLIPTKARLSPIVGDPLVHCNWSA